MKRARGSFIMALFFFALTLILPSCGHGPYVVSIEVTPDSPSIANGMTQQFTATATNSIGSTFDLTTSVTWNSSDTTLATISNDGLATGIHVGSVTITASWDAENSGYVEGSTTLTITQ